MRSGWCPRTTSCISTCRWAARCATPLPRRDRPSRARRRRLPALLDSPRPPRRMDRGRLDRRPPGAGAASPAASRSRPVRDLRGDARSPAGRRSGRRRRPRRRGHGGRGLDRAPEPRGAPRHARRHHCRHRLLRRRSPPQEVVVTVSVLFLLAASSCLLRIALIVIVPASRLPANVRAALDHLVPALLASIIAVPSDRDPPDAVRGRSPGDDRRGRRAGRRGLADPVFP